LIRVMSERGVSTQYFNAMEKKALAKMRISWPDPYESLQITLGNDHPKFPNFDVDPFSSRSKNGQQLFHSFYQVRHDGDDFCTADLFEEAVGTEGVPDLIQEDIIEMIRDRSITQLVDSINSKLAQEGISDRIRDLLEELKEHL